MNETMSNKVLIAAGHEFARHMSSDTPIIDIAKMVTRLASQLDVTTAALRQAKAQFESQSLELKAAFAAEIEWEKAMMQAIGADGIADVVSAIERLKAAQVPDKCPAEIRDLIASHCDALFMDNDAQDIWNACRAAMLSNEPVSEPYKLRENIRREHAAWSQSTFGNVGPVGPLKHLSKEAIEAAEAPDDLSEWADMQFLLWDAQRRAGISDEEITVAVVEKLKVNMARQWPTPKNGEPRFHIKAEKLLHDGIKS